jgi:hypothetical protein
MDNLQRYCAIGVLLCMIASALVCAMAASILIPTAMMLRADLAGLLQRGMFLIAYLWYAREALLLLSRKHPKI